MIFSLTTIIKSCQKLWIVSHLSESFDVPAGCCSIDFHQTDINFSPVTMTKIRQVSCSDIIGAHPKYHDYHRLSFVTIRISLTWRIF